MIRSSLILLAAIAMLAACASTRVVNQWEMAEPGPAFRKLLVVGITENESVRRIFEDEFVKSLAARGVTAIPSYSLIPESGQVPEARLAAAVKASGAEGVMTTRVIRVNQTVDVIPTGPGVWGPPWGFQGWYGSAWGPIYAFPPQVVTRDVVYSEVRLYRTDTDSLVWAATTQTFAPGDARRESAAFAELILKQLSERKLI